MERLNSEQLKREQRQTLASPHALRFSRPPAILLDGSSIRTEERMSKFKVLEIIARVPYQAWENVAYVAMTHTHTDPGFARRIFDRIKETRIQQDNEQWHLLIIGELIAKKEIGENLFLHGFIPQVIAFFYYHISWILYVIRPQWSYLLNAYFEDHAEHEYMEYVTENPDLEAEPFDSIFAADYGQFASLADLFRQIGYDERVHKLESLARVDDARFQ